MWQRIEQEACSPGSFSSTMIVRLPWGNQDGAEDQSREQQISHYAKTAPYTSAKESMTSLLFSSPYYRKQWIIRPPFLHGR